MSLYRKAKPGEVVRDYSVFEKREPTSAEIKVAAALNRGSQDVNAQTDVNAPVNAQPKKRSGSKHPAGYMAAYMRKRRAKK